MDFKITKREWHDTVEAFAYRRSDKCVKLDEFTELVGGMYSSHECTSKLHATKIYEDFIKMSYKLFNGEKPFCKVTNIHFVQNTNGHVKYLIHIFKLPHNSQQRSNIGVNAGIQIDFQHNASYVRIFTMPCKSIYWILMPIFSITKE